MTSYTHLETRADRGLRRRRPALIATLAALGGALLFSPAIALVRPRLETPLRDVAVGSPGFQATVVPQPLEAVKDEIAQAVLDDVAALKTSAGDDWTFYVDRRSGGMALAEGKGIAWIPGTGNRLVAAGVDGKSAEVPWADL